MDEWDWVFFYNEEHNNVESVTTFHQWECDIGSLAEAHPEIIYFYAEFGPMKEWDFNEVAYFRDEFLIPTGNHTAQCGCKLKGRQLLEPCETHREMLGMADMSMFSFPEVGDGDTT